MSATVLLAAIYTHKQKCTSLATFYTPYFMHTVRLLYIGIHFLFSNFFYDKSSLHVRRLTILLYTQKII